MRWSRPRVAGAVLLMLAGAGCARVGTPGAVAAVRSASGVTDIAGAADIADAVPRVERPSRSGNMVEYELRGERYQVLESSYAYDERGIASWYGEAFQGRPTSSGEPYDMHLMTAAHRTLPLPTYVEVTNLANGRKAVLRVNDRGPFHDPARRIIDVSYAAARKLGIVGSGTAPVRVRALEPWQTRTVQEGDGGR